MNYQRVRKPRKDEILFFDLGDVTQQQVVEFGEQLKKAMEKENVIIFSGAKIVFSKKNQVKGVKK